MLMEKLTLRRWQHALLFLLLISPSLLKAQNTPPPPLPLNSDEIDVGDLRAISGVAVRSKGEYILVGDKTIEHAVESNGQRHTHKFFKNFLGVDNICDAEDIAVGVKDVVTQRIFVLGEDSATIYIEGGNQIPLPSEFFDERCGRGAEALTVKWTEEGWDLIVVSEGGIPEKDHILNKSKTPDCKQITDKANFEKKDKGNKIDCPFDPTINDPLMARYIVAENGKDFQLKLIKPLKTSSRLSDKTQGFRASAVTWFKDDLLVLLGSTSTSQSKSTGFNHTWIKGFTPEGIPIPNMTMKLENLDNERWPEYRKIGNWEGLAVASDGKLLMSSDSPQLSKLILFPPIFGPD
jgi:hypothetical protein